MMGFQLTAQLVNDQFYGAHPVRSQRVYGGLPGGRGNRRGRRRRSGFRCLGLQVERS
jgi:hypothetical protein